MRVLVTGSAGHLGEALVRTLRERQHEVAGLDLLDSHSRRAFVETNICGTLNILETALASGVSGIVFTSSTSAFGAALSPTKEQTATWVTEGLQPIPKNIYGVTKSAAEELCELFYRSKGMPTIVLRTSRFFPEADDNHEFRQRYDDLNLKVNEYLYRRVDLADAADAHILAAERVAAIGFGQYIVSATTPFQKDHLSRLRTDVAGVVRSLFPDYEEEYSRRAWRMLPGIDRVYVNHRAQEELGWRPRFDFRYVLDRLQRGEHVFSPLAKIVGSKGYHPRTFEDGPYPIESSG
jgi:nucleoside-diphosphate-sugar epimerase